MFLEFLTTLILKSSIFQCPQKGHEKPYYPRGSIFLGCSSNSAVETVKFPLLFAIKGFTLQTTYFRNEFVQKSTKMLQKLGSPKI